MTDIRQPTHRADLVTTASAFMHASFTEFGHRPSQGQSEALLQLLRTFANAADGTLAPALYLSALPPGTGKSVAIAAFARALMETPAYANTGMLIAVNRVTEVEDMARRLAAHRTKLCIVTAAKNKDAIAMGEHSDANGAQIVIATQASLRRSLQGGKDFPDAARFHYLGRQRAVVAWDESFAFNRPVVLNADSLGKLEATIRLQAPGAVAPLLAWRLHLETAAEGPCQVPDFEDCGIDFRRLKDDAGDSDGMAATAEALESVSGAHVHLKRDDFKGAALLTYTREVPESIMPVIVTDASGAPGVNPAGYDQMATRRTVVRLREATKTYHNLTIRLVNRTASRNAYREWKSTRAREHIEMAVRYVREVAPDDVLIVSYGKNFTMEGVDERTFAKAIDARLTGDEPGRVKHLTWGQHTATNDHVKVRRVLLMGLNFVPRTAPHAASGAALEKPMRTDDPDQHPTREQVADMGRGMLRESTLQAILRGNARMGLDGDCGTMEVVIIQTAYSGLTDEEYQAMFPGAAIEHDMKLLPMLPLKGKPKLLAEAVMLAFAQGNREVAYIALMDATKLASGNFFKLLKRPDWKLWMEITGVRPVDLKGNAKGLRLAGA